MDQGRMTVDADIETKELEGRALVAQGLGAPPRLETEAAGFLVAVKPDEIEVGGLTRVEAGVGIEEFLDDAGTPILLGGLLFELLDKGNREVGAGIFDSCISFSSCSSLRSIGESELIEVEELD